MGYIFKKGREAYSIENQIGGKVKAPIYFDKLIKTDDINDLCSRFDYVVVSNAVNTIAKKLGIWTDTFTAQTRMATVVGSYDPNACTIWFDHRYGKNAFAYMVPNNKREASLALIVNGIAPRELQHYWDEFITIQNIEANTVFITDAEHFCGFVKPVQYKNILFAGNAAGFTDDLLGVGGINAVESGILAARAIALGMNYNELARPIYEDIEKLHVLRKSLNTMDNKDYDKVLSIVGTPGIKQFIYNNPLFRVSNLETMGKYYNHAYRQSKPEYQ